MSRASLGVLAVSLCVLAAVASAQTYSITDLGVLKGENESSGFWINDLGDVVGCSDTQTTYGYPCTGLVLGQRAFYWPRFLAVQSAAQSELTMLVQLSVTPT
jgi:hypothetical protein